jgi:Putative primosome component and related proteins
MSAVVDKLLALANPDAALLYLYLSKHGADIDPFPAMKALRFTEARLKTAHTALVGVGLATIDDLPPFSQPGGDAIELSLRDGESGFHMLVEELQRRLQKILSTNDLQALSDIYHQMALPEDVIVLLVSCCIEDVRAKSGPTRLPTMGQIRREAAHWLTLGIDCTAAAESYLAAANEKRSVYSRLLPRLSITGRQPLKTEQEYLDRWYAWGFSDDAIVLAYERTLLKKQSMSWSYCNGILRNWEKKRLFTLAAIEEFERPAAADRTVEEDISWMREFISPQ